MRPGRRSVRLGSPVTAAEHGNGQSQEDRWGFHVKQAAVAADTSA